MDNEAPSDAPSDEPGHAAIAELDHALSLRPHADGHVLSRLTHHLSALREEMIGQCAHSAVARKRLAHVNAVISVVLAAHFPLGAVPWDELQKARDWLAEAVAEVEP